MKTTGDQVMINGHPYTLGEKLGGGVEGAVFVCQERPEFVIKLIYPRALTSAETKKLKEHILWLKNTIGINNELRNKLAIPKGILDDDDIGYIMFRTQGYDCLSNYIVVPQNVDFEIFYKENYKLKKRLQSISFLFHALELIHISGLLFTDLSPNNIMVHPEKNSLIFIDTDNMRRKKDAYLSVLGTPGYMAPEIYIGCEERNKKLLDAGLSEEMFSQSGRLSAESDVFSAAIIAFQLLTYQHPFVGDAIEDGTAEDESSALRCETDYILHENGSNISSTPFVRAFDECKIVTNKIKHLFYRTFVDGKNDPNLRPLAIEFVEAFDEAQDMLTTCETCGANALFSLEEDNFCWDCEKRLGTRVVLGIFNKFVETSRDKLVAEILGDEPLAENGNDSAYQLVSTVLLDENKSRYLYLRHFERTSNRSQYFAKITLMDSISNTVRLQILDTTVISACYLIDRKARGTKIAVQDIRKAQEFNYECYDILFDVVDSRVGKIQTIGRISRR